MSKQEIANLETDLMKVVNKHRNESEMSVSEIDGVLGTIKFICMRDGLKKFDSDYAQDEDD